MEWRRFLAPKWVFGHLLVLAAAITMVFLGRWQLDVSNARHFDLQNFGYALQWWAFSIFAVLMWLKVLRDIIKHDPKTAGRAQAGRARRGAAGLPQLRHAAEHHGARGGRRQHAGGLQRLPGGPRKEGPMTEVASPVRPAYAGALLRYRVMAYVTGVMLATATIMLIIQDVFDVNSIKTPTGLLWVAHGYCFLIYIVTVLHLWSSCGGASCGCRGRGPGRHDPGPVVRGRALHDPLRAGRESARRRGLSPARPPR